MGRPEYNCTCSSRRKHTTRRWVKLSVFDTQVDGHVYHYGGSLTEPPCSQTVEWFVRENVAEIDKSMVSTCNAVFPDHWTTNPLQHLNDRTIEINTYTSTTYG